MKFIYHLVVKILFILLVFTSLHQVQIRMIELNNTELPRFEELKTNFEAIRCSTISGEVLQLPVVGIFMPGRGL